MRVFSPTAEGFRLIFRRPSIPVAEIAWRWSVALAAWFLGALFLVEYAGSLSVNTVDRLLLDSGQPVLVWRALQRIFHGSAFRFTESGAVLGIALVIAWIVIASLGRAATLRVIITELGVERTSNRPANLFSSLMGLNFLRVAVTLAGVVGAIGAVLITSGVWASTYLSVAGAVRLWLLLLALIWFAWIVLNWFLSVAAIFVAKDSLTTFPAIAAVVTWLGERFGLVLAAGIWFGLVRMGAFIMAWVAGFTLLSIAGALGPGPTLFLGLLMLALYCAVADFLYIGRLAAYLAIDRGEQISDSIPGRFFPAGPATSAVDQSELILSDVSLPAT